VESLTNYADRTENGLTAKRAEREGENIAILFKPVKDLHVRHAGFSRVIDSGHTGDECQSPLEIVNPLIVPVKKQFATLLPDKDLHKCNFRFAVNGKAAFFGQTR
jgi:hypothetical protein